MMKRPAVFLDRDNTVIDGAGSAADPAAMKLTQGVAPAIASLCGLGYKVVVVANDAGVATGVYEPGDVEALHERVRTLVGERVNGARIDAFYFCPYDPGGTVTKYKKDHADRLPKAGMLKKAAGDLDVDLEQSWVVGDHAEVVVAGAAAGCRTVMLNSGTANTSVNDPRHTTDAKKGGKGGSKTGAKSGGRSGSRGKKPEPDFLAKNLVEAVRIIASQRKPEASEQISQTRVAGKRWDAQAMAELQKQGRRKPVEPDKKNDAPEPSDDAAPRETEVPEPRPEQRPARPFRPWTVGPEEPPALEHPATTPEPVSQPEAAAEPTIGSPSANQAIPVEQAPGAPPAEPASDSTERTLRLILHELRIQRGSSGEVPQLQIVAIVLQTVAAICLLAALWMGGGDGGNAMFLRWLGVGLMLQMATIATLLFCRPSS